MSDFDGVTFHISTPESKTKILVSIQVKCFNELVKYGAQEVLEREYGPYVVAPENGYNFSVQVDLDSLPDDRGKVLLLCAGSHLSADMSPPPRSTRRPDPEGFPIEAKCNGCALRARIRRTSQTAGGSF